MPASELERLVEQRLVAFLHDEGALHDALAPGAPQAHEIEALIAEAATLAERLPRLSAVEKGRRLQVLVLAITLCPENLEMAIRTTPLADRPRGDGVVDTPGPSSKPEQPDLVLRVAARLKRTGMEKRLLIEGPNARSGNKVDASLLKRIARAHELQTIFTRGGRSMSEMAAAAGLSDAYFTRMLRLGFLVPDITVRPEGAYH